MTNQAEAPWGEASFERERSWYARLPYEPEFIEKAEYNQIREKAHADPEYDLFDRFMPTGRPKHDIGRYALAHGINVPLIRSMEEWQTALRNGQAMLRSELAQDYDGMSGLISSQLIRRSEVYPKDENGTEDRNGKYTTYSNGEHGPTRTIEGPLDLRPDVFAEQVAAVNFMNMGTPTSKEAFGSFLCDGLRDGTLDPAWVMRVLYWEQDCQRRLLENTTFKDYDLPHIDSIWTTKISRWRYVPGVNIRIFRDPIVEGRYYLGGHEAHHEWTIHDGSDSPNVEAHTKRGYRGVPTADTFEYELPTHEIIELYEKVRTLPYFDQRQAPMMEMQYGDDGKLYFLQYLKTGLKINDPGEFELPSGRNVAASHSVRGATRQEGEEVRIYMDPRVLTKSMNGQAFFIDFDMSGFGSKEQVASMIAKVTINHMLSFKDNHFNSAPLYRPPVSIGLWDGVGELEERFHELKGKQKQFKARDKVREVEYIDAIVTSNGRQATVESDWELKTETLS